VWIKSLPARQAHRVGGTFRGHPANPPWRSKGGTGRRLLEAVQLRPPSWQRQRLAIYQSPVQSTVWGTNSPERQGHPRNPQCGPWGRSVPGPVPERLVKWRTRYGRWTGLCNTPPYTPRAKGAALLSCWSRQEKRDRSGFPSSKTKEKSSSTPLPGKGGRGISVLLPSPFLYIYLRGNYSFDRPSANWGFCLALANVLNMGNPN